MSSIYNDSPRERVRVARKLTRAYARYYGKSSRTVSSALFGICVLQAFGDTSQGDTLLKLADVIDPTCSIVEKYSVPGPSGIVTEYDLSCGHAVTDIDGEAPTYCPICGRRIVEEATDNEGTHVVKCPGALEGSCDEEGKEAPAAEETTAPEVKEPVPKETAAEGTSEPQDASDKVREGTQDDSQAVTALPGANPYAGPKPVSTSQQTPEETTPGKPSHNSTDSNE